MDKLATYYVTLKPVKEGRPMASGLGNIAYVSDPAVEEIGIYLNAHDLRVVANQDIQDKILEYLKGCGVEKPSHWKEVSEDQYMQSVKVEMNQPTDAESFNDVSNKDNTGQWLVRYEYTGPKDDKNRSFCSEILGLNRIYTEEEIKNGLSNPEFGIYSIWDYKGSFGCRHIWKRKIYFEDYEDNELRTVGRVPQVERFLDDKDARTLNAYLSKDEKMQVCAPLLIPDKDIYRNDEIGRYNMRFSSETIAELRTLAQDKGVLSKTDLFKDTHRGGTAPSHIVKEWITESKNDPAYTEYGFDINRCPIGTWFVLSQVTDREYWEKEIKGNKKHAYSIEALMNLTIIKMSKMEKEQIVLPEGEHLIDGTIYIVKDGVVIEKKEVTEEQEEVIEEVAEAAAEKEGLETEEKPKEEMAATEEKPAEEMAEAPAEPTVEAPKEEGGEDRVAKLEKAQEQLMEEIAKLKSEIGKPKEEEVEVVMSDSRPVWKRISDGINVINKSK
jgi:hypothetical protein